MGLDVPNEQDLLYISSYTQGREKVHLRHSRSIPAKFRLTGWGQGEVLHHLLAGKISQTLPYRWEQIVELRYLQGDIIFQIMAHTLA